MPGKHAFEAVELTFLWPLRICEMIMERGGDVVGGELSLGQVEDIRLNESARLCPFPLRNTLLLSTAPRVQRG